MAVATGRDGAPVVVHDAIMRIARRDHNALRAQALLRLGRKDEAREALALAEAAGLPNREGLLLRRNPG